jgi:hypothetical protein
MVTWYNPGSPQLSVQRAPRNCRNFPKESDENPRRNGISYVRFKDASCVSGSPTIIGSSMALAAQFPDSQGSMCRLAVLESFFRE